MKDNDIIMLPAYANVPEPSHADWRLVKCPVCGADCWESDLHREVKQMFPGMRSACTPCALRASVQDGTK